MEGTYNPSLFEEKWLNFWLEGDFFKADVEKAKEKNKIDEYNRFSSIWKSLDEGFQKDLKQFLLCDDLGKGK